jgi:hypothetical protein
MLGAHGKCSTRAVAAWTMTDHFLAITGWATGRLGFKRLFVTSMPACAVASIFCAGAKRCHVFGSALAPAAFPPERLPGHSPAGERGSANPRQRRRYKVGSIC